MKYKIAVNDRKFEIEINDIKEGIAQVTVDGQPFDILIENYEDVATGSLPSGPASPSAAAALTAATPRPAPSPKPAPIPPRVSSPTTGRIEVPSPKKVQTAGEIVAPIPGRIMDIKVKVGDPVAKGQTVATMEAMKMENNIPSTMDGFVQMIRVQKDSEVATGEVIMIIG
jgi:glutaconyl-CoA/methylmalonyl-CoA decarboxylase subunit gamma